MATGGDPGQILRFVRTAAHENAKLGRALTTFGILSVIGGLGFFLVTMAFPFDAQSLMTYRKIAGGLAGYGLPAFLYGLVIVLRGETWITYVSLLGVLLCSLAVLLFLAMYPAQWTTTGSPNYMLIGLVTYSFGAMLCSFGTGGAVGCPDARTQDSGFVWGEPPRN